MKNKTILFILLLSLPKIACSFEYEKDKGIIKVLNNLGDNSSYRFDKIRVSGKKIDTVPFYKSYGPKVRDFSTKMVYSEDRGTALYCGAGHNRPVLNDVWEYHLASNTWYLLHPSDGGLQNNVRNNWRILKAVEKKQSQNQRVDKKLLSKYGQAKQEMMSWYRKYIKFENGYLQTISGGPPYPSHTWDGLTYDPNVKKLLWHPGGEGSLKWYAESNNLSFDELLKKKGITSKVWMYQPASDTWVKQSIKAGSHQPALRGMGATLQYIPDIKKSIFYVAVSNVSPPAYEMWTYDAVNNVWEEIYPNNGQSISALSRNGVSPFGEVQSAYSTRDKKLVVLSGSKTWSYDVLNKEWSFIVDDPKTRGHHVNSVFVYDSVNDIFTLIQPGSGYEGNKRSPYIIRTMKLKEKRWVTVTQEGPEPRKGKWWPPAGYYDPEHNVVVTYNSEEIWLYRYKK